MPPDNSVALVPVAETRYGPAMQALPTDQWRAFVVALVTTGCSATEAAQAAGYAGDTRPKLTAAGHRLAHDPRVQAAIHEESIRRISAHVPAALNVLIEISRNKSAKNSDRIKAATEILDRGGLHAISEHHVSVTHQTDSEKDAEILALARELGLGDDATAKLLGHKPAIDAEFTEVTEPRGPGRPITNPDRTDAERAANLAGKYRTPEERAAHNAELAEKRRAEGKEAYRKAQDVREAEKLGLTLTEYQLIKGSEGLEDVLGLDDPEVPVSETST